MPSKPVPIRLDEALLAKIDTRASAAGLKRNAWIRNTLEAAADEDTGPQPKDPDAPLTPEEQAGVAPKPVLPPEPIPQPPHQARSKPPEASSAALKDVRFIPAKPKSEISHMPGCTCMLCK